MDAVPSFRMLTLLRSSNEDFKLARAAQKARLPTAADDDAEVVEVVVEAVVAEDVVVFELLLQAEARMATQRMAAPRPRRMGWLMLFAPWSVDTGRIRGDEMGADRRQARQSAPSPGSRLR